MMNHESLRMVNEQISTASLKMQLLREQDCTYGIEKICIYVTSVLCTYLTLQVGIGFTSEILRLSGLYVAQDCEQARR